MAPHAPGAALSAPPSLPERYRPLRPLAAGGSAVVWSAEDRRLGRRVAVKLLADPYAGDPDAGRRFKREARAAARLSAHPHVVTIFDVGQTPAGRPFLVMEQLSAGTVADALRARHVSLEEAVRWVREAGAALDFAHAHGILHRDVKPANLLLDGGRRLHVADFGIAQVGVEETMTTGHVLGTASYLPPERALGRPACPASDLYSLAVVAFELVTGERPFTAPTVVALARQHLEAPRPRASERNRQLSGEVDAVLARGMARLPEQRFDSGEAFAEALATALAGVSHPALVRAAAVARARRRVTAAHGPAAARTSPRSRRVPLGLVAGAAAGLAIAAGGVVWTAVGERSGRPVAAARRSASVVAARPAPPAGRGHRSPPPARPRGAATATAVPAASRIAAPTADVLEARGHALLGSGEYGAAIPVLRAAIGAAGPDSLTYAYALYDLGHALRLAGQPQAAVAVLRERLQIPNQTPTVRAELDLALRALRTPAPAPPPRTSGGAALPVAAPDHHRRGGPRGHREHRYGHRRPPARGAPNPGGAAAD